MEKWQTCCLCCSNILSILAELQSPETVQTLKIKLKFFMEAYLKEKGVDLIKMLETK